MNKLRNPAFEGVYNIQGRNEIKVAPEWTAYYLEGRPASAPDAPNGLADHCQPPEYDPATMLEDPVRVYQGEKSQKIFSMWKVMEAYVFQRLMLPVGVMATAKAIVQAYASDSDFPYIVDKEFYLRLGVDPLGGTNPLESWVVWTPWTQGTSDWLELELQLKTTGQQNTFFIGCWNKYRIKHADAYLGFAMLDVPEEPEPPPVGDYVTRQELVGLLRGMADDLEGV